MRNRLSAWRIWAKALGEKSGKDNQESDNIAVIRSIIFATYLITNVFIVSGVVRHWNDVECEKQSRNGSFMVKIG